MLRYKSSSVPVKDIFELRVPIPFPSAVLKYSFGTDKYGEFILSCCYGACELSGFLSIHPTLSLAPNALRHQFQPAV